jgi:hypothetical protein
VSGIIGRFGQPDPPPFEGTREEAALELIRRLAGASVEPIPRDGQALLGLLDRIGDRDYFHSQVTALVGRVAALERQRPELTPELLDELGVKELRLVRRRQSG